VARYDAGHVDEARMLWFELEEEVRRSPRAQAVDRRFARTSASYRGQELRVLQWTPAPPSLPADLLIIGTWEPGDPDHPAHLARLQALHDHYASSLVSVVGVTRALGGADQDQVDAARSTSAPTLPVAVDASWFTATPLRLTVEDQGEAVLVWNTQVVWSGPIERLSDELVERWRSLPRHAEPFDTTWTGELPAERVEPTLMVWGERVYHGQTAGCATCHGPEGAGAGTFPPLAGQEDWLGDCARAADVVLNGLKGPIDVGGERYDGLMVAYAPMLDDVQVASVLTYIRNSWGNDFGPCLPEQVEAVRLETR
jgi:mono/diheme cytochrome c family protein